jgi:ferredoxin
MSARFVEQRVGSLTVRIDREACIATQSCIRIAPEVFDLDDTAIVAFRDGAEGLERARLLDACARCPVDALAVFDEHGAQLVP